MKMGDEYVAVARQVPVGTTAGQVGTPQKPVVVVNNSNGTIPIKGIVPIEKETTKEREDGESAWWID